MSLPPLQARHYAAELLTEHFHFAGNLEPFGQLMIYLNDPERNTILLKNVTATTLDVGGTLDHFQAEELWFRRDEILAIRMLDPISSSTMPLMPKVEKLRLFVPRFIIQASFYTGPETRIGDIFDTKSYWVPSTDALVHHLMAPKHPVFHDAKVLLINKRHIRFYQSIGEPAAK